MIIDLVRWDAAIKKKEEIAEATKYNHHLKIVLLNIICLMLYVHIYEKSKIIFKGWMMMKRLRWLTPPPRT
jgi:hypothetical protein